MWSLIVLAVAILLAFYLAFWLQRKYPPQSVGSRNIATGVGCAQLAVGLFVVILGLGMLLILGNISSMAGGGFSGLCLGMLFAMAPLVVLGKFIAAVFAFLFGTSSKN